MEKKLQISIDSSYLEEIADAHNYEKCKTYLTGEEKEEVVMVQNPSDPGKMIPNMIPDPKNPEKNIKEKRMVPVKKDRTKEEYGLHVVKENLSELTRRSVKKNKERREAEDDSNDIDIKVELG